MEKIKMDYKSRTWKVNLQLPADQVYICINEMKCVRVKMCEDSS